MKFFTTNIIILLLISLVISCKKDKTFSENIVHFSDDTLKFDTVFTTLGSATKFFTIKNKQDKAIKIDELKLSNASNFRINVDGDTGKIFNDIIIPANDSIYVFVEVTINPNAENLPFVLLASVELKIAQHQQKIWLQAYGQNAHFFDRDTIVGNVIWNNDLPYVILNHLSVDKNSTLTIDAGCKVYFGGNAAMQVEGTLNINGENDTTNAVLFRTYRLDKDVTGTAYEKYPGQWAGLFFQRESTGNINFLNLQNSQYGISVGSIATANNTEPDIEQLQNATLANGAVLTIKNSKIYNNSFYNIFGFLSTIQAVNLLCYNAGTNIVGLYHGGNYVFINCTFYAQSNAYISHSRTPAFYFSNYFIGGKSPVFADFSNLIVRNSIIYGTADEEIILDDNSDNPNPFSYTINHSCIKNKSGSLLTKPNVINCINTDPKFENSIKTNFWLKDNSPCIDSGNDSEYFPVLDLKGNPRIGKPDMGALEKQ